MALNNQPYLPLYVNDWLGNTKLKSCSALAHGIMINVMLLMHKEDDYGVVLLKQKYKQNDQQILNFASQFAKVLPFDLLEINAGLIELIEEKALFLDGDLLKCKRMMKDADISLKRSLSGSKGGNNSFKANNKQGKKGSKRFAQAKTTANTDIEINNENKDEENISVHFKKAFTLFLKMRDAIKKPASDRAIELLRMKIEKLAPNDEPLQIKLIEQSTINNWQDIFPLRDSSNLAIGNQATGKVVYTEQATRRR